MIKFCSSVFLQDSCRLGINKCFTAWYLSQYDLLKFYSSIYFISPTNSVERNFKVVFYKLLSPAVRNVSHLRCSSISYWHVILQWENCQLNLFEIFSDFSLCLWWKIQKFSDKFLRRLFNEEIKCSQKYWNGANIIRSFVQEWTKWDLNCSMCIRVQAFLFNNLMTVCRVAWVKCRKMIGR